MSKFNTENNLNTAKELFIQSQKYQNEGYLIKAKNCLEEAFTLIPTRESIINNLIILYFTLKENENLRSFLKQINKSQNEHLHKLGQLYLDYLDDNFHKCIQEADNLLKQEDQVFKI